MPERQPRNVGNAIVRYLLTEEAIFPGKTLGEIEVGAGLDRGTATHQRITEKRKQGYPIVTIEVDGQWRYHIVRAKVRLCERMLELQKAGRFSEARRIAA